ncbi:GPI ethanolamine phosphate transferase 3-like protein [Lasiosphaeria miniovina]|uniref:GPI ethanolamine phosphate transferase 3-like protein n=1 Tax=Lasiosphaeria miniovina TaxID=1954250 RepID=A0AA40AVZ6_9PEZI|nr:GPI ethanolamine phosphate transferase 3-like protein [Lasiosphaeria miniovina]KAK0722981.1 GPI ethanolamine phosphate transferase 3-like protein [Lasiosphaeria miniovina]
MPKPKTAPPIAAPIPPTPTPSKSRMAPKSESEYAAISAQFDAAKSAKAEEDALRDVEREKASVLERQREALESARKASYEARWLWTVGVWVWMLCIHVVGIGLFTGGFLLARLVLDDKSSCDAPPTLNSTTGHGLDILGPWAGKGTVEGGCWHPKTFDRAVIVLIDALRYDFTVPVDDNSAFHNALPFMYDTSLASPNNAFLRPFIADPPTATMQRLKGLTTGTLPTFIDLGSSFAGTAIEEDNLLMQLRDAGKRIVHLGDDTWDSLFPGYFEANLSRPYDSFNVRDLHTVDNGVIEHIFPLMSGKGDWDVLIGHCLGVDHAGHRYGPEHVEMTKKLRQMDTFIRDLAATMDEKTVLIVMGDHGMDEKGDHGGESDDEVEAALWMYSPKPVFGRTDPQFVTPPATAKLRPVNQIDLVPTLALLLGIPIPFNNLGRPIEEAFAGPTGKAWNNLAAAERTTAAGIQRYQASYSAARGIQLASLPGSPADLWNQAEALVSGSKKRDWAAVYSAFAAYQQENLKRFKSLWARFDLTNMILGIAIMALGVITLLVYVASGGGDDTAVDDPELDRAEKSLQMQGITADEQVSASTSIDKRIVTAALVGAVPVFLGGVVQSLVSGAGGWYRGAGVAALTSIVAVLVALFRAEESVFKIMPRTFWGWLAVVFTLSQSIGFASNSYTIWEDSILLFFVTTFGFVTALSAFRLPSLPDRYLSIYHSILFVLLGRVASFSKLCREEQMPYCTSTYYASATSSTSAPWQLAIPFLIFFILPTIVKAYLTPTRSYEGLAPVWIGYVFRTGLFLSATYWALDAADNGNWVQGLPEKMFRNISVYTAQIVLGLAFVAGTTAFIWAPPCVSIVTTALKPGKAQVVVLGHANAHGARYLFLPLNFLAACFLLSKPMGGGALGIMMWQILSLLEILDLNSLTTSPIGPIILALLGNFHFFKTGHQATLSSIQWDSAFIPLFNLRYPWSPVVVALNTFAGQILATVAVPLVVLWKVNPASKGALDRVSRALGTFVAFFAVESLATMAWAGWLRRHLMLFRVFSPRFMTAAIVLLIVDVVGIAVTLTGVRCNTLAISDVFGWAE